MTEQINLANKKLWRAVFTTDPSAVKEITGKQYKGNSPKPYFLIERATDVFGPCGIGWGIQVLNERYERFDKNESLHIATVKLWYMLDGKRGEIEQMGQTRASYITKDGKFIVDEDAPKKSVTDAMVKCMSMLGFAGDIFSGRWDDSRYVEHAKKETYSRKKKEFDAVASVQMLNDDQIALLRDLIKKANMDEKKFALWITENTTDDLTKVTVSNFPQAKLNLEKRIKKITEQQAALQGQSTSEPLTGSLLERGGA